MKLKVYKLDALATAGEKHGLRMEKRSTHKWYGQFMGDYPLPEGITKDDLGRCDYVLFLPNNPDAYEVGVKLMPDGSYTLLWDFWEGGFGLEEAIGENGVKLISEYEATVYREVMIEQGFEVSEVVHANGTRELTATQW